MPSPAPFRPLRALLLPLLLLLGACQSGSKSKPETAAAVASPAAPDSAAFTTRHPEWARHATIYQVNMRQYTPQGTFRAAEADLPRLQKMGVGILWLMPINPIGLSHRKGTLADLQHIRRHRPPPRPSYPEAAGRRHLAFAVPDVVATIRHLAAHGVVCEPVRVDELTGRRFTFFADPDGLPLEFYEM